MKYDPKCYELAEHFLPNGSKEDKAELAEMLQWFAELYTADDKAIVQRPSFMVRQ